MVKMRKKIALTVIVLALFIAGCTTLSRTRREEPREINYRTGTEGLTLTFPANMPTRVYEDDRPRFTIEVRNKGAFPQNEEKGDATGKLWFGGFDTQILDIQKATPGSDSGQKITQGYDLVWEELEGKSPYNKDGGYSGADFIMEVKKLPTGMPFYKPKIIITAVYKYVTIANPIVCIDPEPRSTRIREKVCNIESSISVGSQGAPIAVTRVEEDVTTTGFLFKIYIENVGKGMVIAQDGDLSKNPNEGYEWNKMNKVKIENVWVGTTEGSTGMMCKPAIDSTVQLVDGKGYIFCTLAKGAIKEAYQTSLNIKLSYGYTTSIQKEMEILKQVSFQPS